MSKPEGFDLADRARALAPLITGDADEMRADAAADAGGDAGLDRERALSGAAAEAFWRHRGDAGSLHADAGGGGEADASTAWLPRAISVCAMTAAYLEPDAAHQIFNVAPGILAWGAIAHR